jgi:uncharacterized protein (DUF1697 family)
VATFLRTTSELAAIAAYGPFNESDLRAAGASLYIGFVADRPGDGEISGLQAYATESDAFHVHEREIYWLCRTRMSDSKFSGAVLEKTLGMPATLRNANTLRKIVAKYG